MGCCRLLSFSYAVRPRTTRHAHRLCIAIILRADRLLHERSSGPQLPHLVLSTGLPSNACHKPSAAIRKFNSECATTRKTDSPSPTCSPSFLSHWEPMDIATPSASSARCKDILTISSILGTGCLPRRNLFTVFVFV